MSEAEVRKRLKTRARQILELTETCERALRVGECFRALADRQSEALKNISIALSTYSLARANHEVKLGSAEEIALLKKIAETLQLAIRSRLADVLDRLLLQDAEAVRVPVEGEVFVDWDHFSVVTDGAQAPFRGEGCDADLGHELARFDRRKRKVFGFTR